MSTTLRNFTSGLALGVIALLVACSGGGGSSSGGGYTPPTGGGATPTPIVTPTPVVANASGKVVDEAANTPLAGIPVAVASAVPNAPYAAVATTAADGTFAFTTTPGSYVLRIGDGGTSGAIGSRATLYQNVTLAAGANPSFAGITPNVIAGAVYTTAQTSGNFRLITLNANQSDCITGANAGRTGALTKFVPDEYLEEEGQTWVQLQTAQKTDTPVPVANTPPPAIIGSGSAYTGYATASAGAASCSAWTGTGYSYVVGNPPYVYATDAANVRYGANFGSSDTTYGYQTWMADPR